MLVVSFINRKFSSIVFAELLRFLLNCFDFADYLML